MKPFRILSIPLLAATMLLGTLAHAADRTADANGLDQTLINAFECRSLAPNIDAALKARRINTDGTTHTTLNPVLTVFGHHVADVTVFRQGSEDIYTSYLTLTPKQQKDVANSTINPAQARQTLSVTTGPSGQTVIQCSMPTSGDMDEGIVHGDWEQHLVTIGPDGISVR